jgi:hypothetical protein
MIDVWGTGNRHGQLSSAGISSKRFRTPSVPHFSQKESQDIPG